MGRVVVGIDGSQCAKQALAVAVDQALVHGWELEVVTAVVHHLVGVPGARWPVETREQLEAQAEALQQEAFATVPAEDLSEIEVRRRTVLGHAPNVLVDASDGADLLVVGSRGRGGIKAALLGSVSQHCVTHASCPVLVVRTERAVAQVPRSGVARTTQPRSDAARPRAR